MRPLHCSGFNANRAFLFVFAADAGKVKRGLTGNDRLGLAQADVITFYVHVTSVERDMSVGRRLWMRDGNPSTTVHPTRAFRYCVVLFLKI